jgi:hypothetical protein
VPKLGGVRHSDFVPDLRLFVNAQAAKYAGEQNNLMGDIQLSPVKASKGRVQTKPPESVSSLNFCQTAVLLDSGAFSEVRTGKPLPGGGQIKQRWGLEEAERAVEETVSATRFLAGCRDTLSPHTLVFACQGVDTPQYLRCAGRILEFCQPQAAPDAQVVVNIEAVSSVGTDQIAPGPDSTVCSKNFPSYPLTTISNSYKIEKG